MMNRLVLGLGAIGLAVLGSAVAEDKAAAPAAPPAAAKPADAAKDKPVATEVKSVMTPKLPRRPPPPPPLVARWGQIDADHDGKASFAEIKQVLPDFQQSRFDVLDRNHDGVISTDELPPTPGAAAGDNSKSPIPNAGQPAFGLMRVLELADTNKDMKVTPEEYKAAFPNQPEGRFKELDKNGDGVLNSADLPLQPDPAGGLKRADTNGDGKVSREEFMAAFPKSPPDRFSKLDRNGDGFWDELDTKIAAPPINGPAKPVEQDWVPVIKTLLVQYDKDKDGKITWEEYSAGKPGLVRAGFDKLDTNHDGVITVEDKAPTIDLGSITANTPGESAERIKHADKDGDGRLSYEEAAAEFKGLTRERFNARDLNGDGFLGPEDRALRKMGIVQPIKKSNAPDGGKPAAPGSPTAASVPKPAAEAGTVAADAGKPEAAKSEAAKPAEAVKK